MAKRECRICEYSSFTLEENGSLTEGECHRYPPIIKTGENTEFPFVFPDDWCGEFKEEESNG